MNAAARDATQIYAASFAASRYADTRRRRRRRRRHTDAAPPTPTPFTAAAAFAAAFTRAADFAS